MRKILLASTALVACGTVAAHAADVSINGTTDWHYFTYDNDTNTGARNGSYIDYDMDLDFKFSTTTDSGLSLTMGAGIAEGTGGMDDQYLDIAGDFGTLRLSDNLEGLADSAMDESVADNMSTLAPGLAMHGADLNGNTVMYTLPAMNGLTVKAHYQDAGTTTKGDNTAFLIEYAADVANGAVKAQYISSTTDDTGATGNTAGTDSDSMGIRVTMNDFQVTASQHTKSDNSNTYDYKNNVIDVKYSGIEGVSISAFSLSGDDDLNNSYDFTQSAASLTYTIASGLTASVTMTDSEVTDASGTVSSDDSTALNIKATF
jgi:hypothetical protein